MQIFAMCVECQKELGHPSFEPFFVPYFEDRIGHIMCARGHKSVLVIQSQKFEVLMESGANALAAGFTLEACASFSAALERLYEFSLKVLSAHSGVTEEIYKETYKEMSRQSERQLGAFLILYSLQFGSAYKPNRSIVEFRNAVIHKGLIPTPKEAHEFCSKVYSEILEITERLQGNLPEAVNQAVAVDLQERSAKADESLPKATSSGSVFFSLSRRPAQKSFDEAFYSFKEATKKLLGSIPQMEALHTFFGDIEAHNKSFKPTPNGAT